MDTTSENPRRRALDLLVLLDVATAIAILRAGWRLGARLVP